jgi:hypothetical protein
MSPRSPSGPDKYEPQPRFGGAFSRRAARILGHIFQLGPRLPLLPACLRLRRPRGGSDVWPPDVYFECHLQGPTIGLWGASDGAGRGDPPPRLAAELTSVSCLVPASPAVPAAAENNQHDDEDDQKCRRVHCYLLKRAARLRRPNFLRTADADNNALAHDRCLDPCPHQPKQELLLFLGLGLSDPKQGLFGVLPKLTGL